MKVQPRAKRSRSAALPRALGPHRAHYGLSPRVFDLLLRAGRLSGATELNLSGELGDAELSALLATADLSSNT